jgi:rhamnogalacturonan endolyase
VPNVVAATCTTSEPVADVEIAGTADGCGTPNGSFGLTTTTDLYTVNTGGGLVFSVRRTDPTASTQAAGDISSLKYNGVEFQDQTRGSQIGVGLGGGTVSATTYGSNYIKITATSTDGDLTHYYIAKNGCSNVYMATHFTSEPSLGNVRYIARILRSMLPNGPTPSDLEGTTGAIEASDVFGLANGETRSKHYSNHRQMDWSYTGATGTNVGIWMMKGNEEGMSGGPFYRNLINQGTTTNQEIYALINYGESQTEAFRTSVLNTYTLMFTNGSRPKAPDLSFESALDLVDYVPTSARGNVVGVGIAGRDSCHPYVVGFANAQAQYWTVAAANGSYSRYGMLPGTYDMTIYQGEYAVWSGSVTVNAGASTALNTITIAAAPNDIPVLWRIGEWDGHPFEFLNGPKLRSMHPQDARMAAWVPTTYVVGKNKPSEFPSAQFRGANSPTTIKFNLTAAQAAVAHTLKVGITVAYNNGRPQAVVNGHTLTSPAASNQPKTRSLTVGTYRGNNTTFSWLIAASDFVTGENTLTLTPISGNTDLGTYLSASYSYDCVQLEE